MKKYLLALGLLLAMISAQADQFLGGELTWECAGSGQYIFQVIRYQDCTGINVPDTAEVHINGYSQTIYCLQISDAFISPQCYNLQSSLNCDTSIVYTPVKRYVYKSAPVTLGMPIPSNGLAFFYIEDARPNTTNTTNGAANGYQLRAIMHPYLVSGTALTTAMCYDNAPVFGEQPRFAFNTEVNQFWLDGADPDHQDSVFFAWAEPLNYGTTYPQPALVFDTGYAYNNPLPSSSLNSNNQDVVLIGSGSVQFKSVMSGRFTYCYKIQSYRNGQLISEVFRDAEFQINTDPGISGLCSAPVNNVPAVSFATTPSYPSPVPVLVNGQISHYEINVLAGDSITFTATGSDFDVRPDCSPELVTALPSGLNLGVGCQNPPCATITSLNTGGNLVGINTSSLRFSWGTDTAHVLKEEGHATFDYFFEFQDGHCILPGQGMAKLQVNILRPIYASAYYFRICEGDSAQVQILGDTSNLSWSVGAGLSCTTCANPYLYPTTSTTYTVTDVNTGYQISIEVQVDPTLALPQLAQQGADLVVNNAAAFDTISWRRNFGPFYPQPTNTYTPFLSGAYWVQSSAGACQVQSQKIDMWFGDNLAANSDSTGEWFNTRNANLTHGCTFRLQHEAFYTLDGVYLLAFAKSAQSVTTTLKCKIYDQSSALVFTSDSAVRISDDLIKFYGAANLTTNADYLLAIYTDTSVFVPTFKPSTWPVVANQGRVFVFNATNAVGNTIPTTNAPDYPFVHFSLKWGIGTGEFEGPSINIYPNPAADILVVKAVGATSYQLVDALGRAVIAGAMSEQVSLNTSALAQGVYMLSVGFAEGQTLTKRVVISR
jgi:hypothetical protein